MIPIATSCTKRGFQSETAAQNAISRIGNRKPGQPDRPRSFYKCDKCGSYHLTSQTRKEQAAIRTRILEKEKAI